MHGRFRTPLPLVRPHRLRPQNLQLPVPLKMLGRFVPAVHKCTFNSCKPLKKLLDSLVITVIILAYKMDKLANCTLHLRLTTLWLSLHAARAEAAS